MSIATEVDVERDLDAYAQQLRWVIERKDFNDFWPVGLPWAATAMGDALVERVEQGLAGVAPEPVPNPTVATLLLFFSTYGMREAGWSRERRLGYAERLLAVVRASKRSSVMNVDGVHHLVAPTPVLLDGLWKPATPERVTAVNRLAATLWAFGEAAYFCNHRIATERHGPYPSEPGRLVLIRSAYNLTPSVLWPEVGGWPSLPRRIDLCVDHEAVEAPFDLFANPLFTFNATVTARRVAVIIEHDDGAREHDPSPRALERLAGTLAELIGTLTRVVRCLSERERAERLHRIMLYGLERLGGRPCLADAVACDRAGDGRVVEGDAERLARYYDLRETTA